MNKPKKSTPKEMADIVAKISTMNTQDIVSIVHSILHPIKGNPTPVVFINVERGCALMQELEDLEDREKMIETETALELLEGGNDPLEAIIKEYHKIGIQNIVIGS